MRWPRRPDEVARARMVRRQIQGRGLRDKALLDAFMAVPRHRFVPPAARALAYADSPLAIGDGQTISQPYIVALMTARAGIGRGSRVLELGTGSGYQAAILAAMGAVVYTIERIPQLHRAATALLAELGYEVDARLGDGYAGWPEAAPFDAILSTAAPETLPPGLVAQLRVGGRLVIPVGPADDQRLLRITRTEDGAREEVLCAVRFVPLVAGAV